MIQLKKKHLPCKGDLETPHLTFTGVLSNKSCKRHIPCTKEFKAYIPLPIQKKANKGTKKLLQFHGRNLPSPSPDLFHNQNKITRGTVDNLDGKTIVPCVGPDTAG